MPEGETGKNMIRTKSDACPEKREHNLECSPMFRQLQSLASHWGLDFQIYLLLRDSEVEGTMQKSPLQSG